MTAKITHPWDEIEDFRVCEPTENDALILAAKDKLTGPEFFKFLADLAEVTD